MAKVYQHIGGLNPRRSAFNTSHSKLFNCDMGQLIPIHCKEQIPGDHVKITSEIVVRFQPLIAPILHEIFLRTFWFFVPTRLIMNRDTVEDLGDTGEWVDFITGGQDGKDTTELPLWIPPAGGYGKYSLWDYFGDLGDPNVVPTMDSMPLRFPKRCYNLVFNEYVRSQDLQDEVSLDDDEVKNICWSKDRFTTALYDVQRGEAIAIPLSGIGSASFNVTGTNNPFAQVMTDVNTTAADMPVIAGIQGTAPRTVGVNQSINVSAFAYSGTNQALNNNSITFDEIGGISPTEVRRVMQLKKMLERNMRSGARYTEQLRSRFGVYPQDSRLQRPEFIGGSRSPIIVSEVLNTTGTNQRPQGDLAGHGISAQSTPITKYRVKEHGYIIGLMAIQPVPVYNLGINKQWQRRTRFDFPTPELVNLSEVAVKNSELIVTGTSRDDEIFGYQGIYDEMRISESAVCGDMRNGEPFDHWSLARDDYDVANPPSLNENFVKCTPTKRIFAVQNEPGIIVHSAVLKREVRPLPLIAMPGLLDHH